MTIRNNTTRTYSKFIYRNYPSAWWEVSRERVSSALGFSYSDQTLQVEWQDAHPAHKIQLLYHYVSPLWQHWLTREKRPQNGMCVCVLFLVLTITVSVLPLLSWSYAKKVWDTWWMHQSWLTVTTRWLMCSDFVT